MSEASSFGWKILGGFCTLLRQSWKHQAFVVASGDPDSERICGFPSNTFPLFFPIPPLTSQTNYWHQILVSGSDVAETSILLEKPDHRSWSKMQIPRHSRRAALNAPPWLSFVCYHFFFFF
jgi:hypothetical protein